MISQIQTGFYNLIKLWAESWTSGSTYGVGEVLRPITYNSHTYKCTTAGTGGVNEPNWTSTDGALTYASTVGGTAIFACYDPKTYNVIAPPTSSVPYVTYGLLTERPIGDFADFEAVEDLTFYVNCFSDRSIADLSEIADEVMDALDNKDITASGFTSLKVTREFIGSTIYDIETNTYQVPLRYRLWLDKT